MSTLPSAGPHPGVTGGDHLLEVRGLQVEFRTRGGVVKAVGGISYTLDQGETLAILGESGSGKSVSAQAVIGLIDTPPGYITGGQVLFKGRDLLTLTDRQLQEVRGPQIAMVFQDALTALNPVYPVGWQIAEMLRVHRGVKRKPAGERAVDLMERVGIPLARERAGNYPHEFSGGMRQRVMIAMSLALDPDILIADEPTTALDVTVQAQVMELLAKLQEETGMGLILITHDLGVVADVADKVAVMYAGQIVETGTVREVYRRPAHPYTRGLMASIPQLHHKGGRLDPIKGAPPSLVSIPPGCPFHPRCPYARDRCAQDHPPLFDVGAGRRSACHYYDEVLADG